MVAVRNVYLGFSLEAVAKGLLELEEWNYIQG
jgi:hypothetical protein